MRSRLFIILSLMNVIIHNMVLFKNRCMCLQRMGCLPFNHPLSFFEMGFGTGLNAYLTALHSTKPIIYDCIELYPLSKSWFLVLIIHRC